MVAELLTVAKRDGREKLGQRRKVDFEKTLMWRARRALWLTANCSGVVLIGV
jgi:hypothetical protein